MYIFHHLCCTFLSEAKFLTDLRIYKRDNILVDNSMATVELMIDDNSVEFLDDQIVPDQDDCFLPPGEATITQQWNVSMKTMS